jgi:hypothetical protein
MEKFDISNSKVKQCVSVFLMVHTENISIPALAFPQIFVPFLYSGVQVKKYAVVNNTLFAIDCAREHLA